MWLDNLGGRKFVLAVLAVAAGCAIAVMSPKGLDTQTVGLLLGIVAAFNVANAHVTTKMAGQQQQPQDDDLPTLPEGLVHAAEYLAAPAAIPVASESTATTQRLDVLPQVLQSLNELHNRLAQVMSQQETHAGAMNELREGVSLAQKASKAALTLRGAPQV